MKDLIERQAAINLLKKWADGYAYIENETELAVKEFQELPSAQPEIIRCEDCIWWKDEDCTNPVGMFLPDEDDFCSGATRRTDESNV